MVKALLLDLDGTLLDNPMELFVREYLQALGAFLAGHVSPERLVPELLRATQVMAANDGNGPTNEDLFASVFYPALGQERDLLEPVIRRFYAEEFPKLRRLTRPVPQARSLVEWAFDAGLRVAVATNPLFPRIAIEQRLEWAGVGTRDFRYALVTTYETMHASKASPAYYREILQQLDLSPGDCVMVGDDWAWDIVPATGLGLSAWWVAAPETEPPKAVNGLLGSGSLAQFFDRLRGLPPLSSDTERKSEP